MTKPVFNIYSNATAIRATHAISDRLNYRRINSLNKLRNQYIRDLQG